MRGCSWPELYSILRQSGFLSLPIAIVIAIVWGNYSTILATTPVLFALFFWALTARMARLKNGRPVGYFVVKSALKKQRKGFGKKKFIEHDGFWKISKD
jgi:conjugative transfer region protein (TIGR03750 family)